MLQNKAFDQGLHSLSLIKQFLGTYHETIIPAIIISKADNSIKNWRNLSMSNPNPDLHNIKAHIKYGKNPLRFTQVIVLKLKYRYVEGR